ncbi:MAG TPA: hypothetical protein HA282_04505 [Nanoarchaeota archaeon]|nr:hypothetical protein [Candidatus Pacearchaeota archaeon]HIH17539.1 hypothetical protein [Nanoarchaeota archaeon]HIH34517.1 hypothetical protein [Nanoarchaeota archaeon]HIH51510.1 hypothetical protein [Nanoarchaeota archaeon]HIH66446.1 hypothetical protein [Nanoarchaeota archaeon]
MGKEHEKEAMEGKVKNEFKKAISIAVILALVINMILFAARKIHALQFWLVMIAAAIFAFIILKKWK